MQLPARSSGVLLHITSLPSPYGIGDLGPAAFHFVDWLKNTGQSIWQLLPTTPIGPADSPYQSVSAFAGSPLMVAFEPMVQAGWLKADDIKQSLVGTSFDPHRVNYAAVVPWRMALLRKAWAGFEQTGTAAQRDAMAKWAIAQAYWLDDYTLFMALETAHDGKCWWQWSADLMQRKAAALKKARAEQQAEIGFWTFVQWCFDTQMSTLKAYANQHGIAIFGDLPIFIAHHSADCWARPDLYYLDDQYQPTVVAGVPPDDMGPQGQRWGNPLYRWDKMAKEKFAWWTSRVRRALDQADIFRIDHFRGFAGYWEIPSSCPTAMEGQWVPGPGKALFDAIEKELGKLPIVAEDLGLITPDVIELRDSCGFPGMKILQFGFGAKGDHEFLPHNYTVNSVVYTGTHDNQTVRGWWDEAPPQQRLYAGTYLVAGQNDIHWGMIRAAANSVSASAIYQFQDILGLDGAHRMNVPGTASNNWVWRFTWDMVGAEPGRVLGVITAASGRGPFELMAQAQ